MFVKLISFLSFVTLLCHYSEAETCRLFCEECPEYKLFRTYYCCQSESQSFPIIKNCNSATAATTTTTISPGTEWMCPVDPLPRASLITGYSPQLVDCTKDSDCISHPVIQKCCFDQAVGNEVCKPAMLV